MLKEVSLKRTLDLTSFKVIEGEQKGVKILVSSTHLLWVRELQLRHVNSQMEKRSLSKKSTH